MGRFIVMKPKLASNIIIRVDDELKSRLNRVQDMTGYSISEVVRQSLESFAEYYEKNNCIVLPITVIPQKELNELKRKSSKK